jgi:hypothetical protein
MVNISIFFLIVATIFIIPIVIAIFSESVRNTVFFTTRKPPPSIAIDDNDTYYEKRAKQKVNLVLAGIFRMHTLINHENEFQDKRHSEKYKEYISCASVTNFIKNVKGMEEL